MVVPPIRQRTAEVYREAIVLSMEITILLGGTLLSYTLLLILQHIFSYTGVILLSIGVIVLLTLDLNSNSSLPISTIHKMVRFAKQLGHVVSHVTHILCQVDASHSGTDARSSRIVAMWTSYVAYGGLLLQVFFRYPISIDTYFASGLIAIAISANQTFLFSLKWDSLNWKGIVQNLDLNIDGKNKMEENEQVKEIKAKYEEEKEKWEEEKRNLNEQLNKARNEATQLKERTKIPYSMFGNFDWD